MTPGNGWLGTRKQIPASTHDSNEKSGPLPLGRVLGEAPSTRADLEEGWDWDQSTLAPEPMFGHCDAWDSVTPQIQVHLEPQNVMLPRNRVFSHITN